MKRRIIQLFTLITIAVVLVTSVTKTGLFKSNTAYAVGDLTVDWGIGVGNVGPIFTVADAAPGSPATTKTVIVTNGATSPRPVGIRADAVTDTGLASGLEIKISKGATDLYGGTTGTKTLAEFFTDSIIPDFVSLETLAPGATGTYTISLQLPSNAGNIYQEKSVTFNLHIGLAIDTPVACEAITFTNEPIFGTGGNDKLKGGSGNDFIISFDGNDSIDTGSGDDCIVAGNGNNKIDTGSGKDIVISGTGNDNIDTGSDNDTIMAGTGNNSIDAGSGDDTVTGGEGNDTVDAGAGNDTVLGLGGNDKMDGGSGNDTLNGGLGNDTAHGGSDTDTCVSESKTKCEL